MEITKESIGAAADAYAEGQMGELKEPHRTTCKAKIKMHWFAGWLAHSLMLADYIENITQKATVLMAISDAASDFINEFEKSIPYEMDMPEFLALKNLLKQETNYEKVQD